MIIHLEPSDEINTIIRKLGKASTSEVVLVVPPENWILRNEINFQLLIKYSKESAKNLTLKTSDPAVISLAEKYQLAVLIDESAATKDQEHDGNKRGARRKRKSLVQDRLIVVLLVVTAILGLVYYQMPKTLVVVTPTTFEFTEELVYDLHAINGIDLIESQTTVTQKTPATGRNIVGISPAYGVVTLVNQSQDDILVKKDTIVTTSSGIQFKTLNDTVVPAVQTQFFMDIPTGLTAGKGEVDISAVDLGTRGNVSAGRIVNIIGYDLEVRNFDPIVGGEDVVIQVASASDIERARSHVERDGAELVLTQIKDQLGDRVILSETLENKVDWQSASEVDEETNEVIVTGTYSGKVYAVNLENLAEQVSESLITAVPSNFTIDPETITFDKLTVTAGEPRQINVAASVMVSGIVNPEELATVLAGQSSDYLGDFIKENPEISKLEIEQGSLEKFPRLPRWVKVIVEPPVEQPLD